MARQHSGKDQSGGKGQQRSAEVDAAGQARPTGRGRQQSQEGPKESAPRRDEEAGQQGEEMRRLGQLGED